MYKVFKFLFFFIKKKLYNFMLSFDKKKFPPEKRAQKFTCESRVMKPFRRRDSSGAGAFLIGCCVCLMFKNLCMFTQISFKIFYRFRRFS